MRRLLPRLNRCARFAAAMFAAAAPVPAHAAALGDGIVGAGRTVACWAVVQSISVATGVRYTASIQDEYMFLLGRESLLFHCDDYELLTMTARSPGVFSFFVKAASMVTGDTKPTIAALIEQCKGDAEVRHATYHVFCGDGGNYLSLAFDKSVGD